MISVQGKFLCNNITEGFTFFRYNRDTKFERGTKHWQKEWQVSIKKDVLPAEYVKILVRWQLSKFTMDVMLWVGCGKCAKSCPAGCIEMKERTAM